ncbi:DNA translocase FtsK [Hymenobacter actinosclerus]|uniref:Ftsk gamma domain-containing protein n=1 Tax=Hymenobacter actinosclerus TaxID=82805 RepID=A0A1I0EZQ7_9BACT|nr:DNA translocase FtsK [Hymenobacter actinosclerus]SET50232.1 Ftsk gamma domain-containing protein [Hymenobacter actinosclerus]
MTAPPEMPAETLLAEWEAHAQPAQTPDYPANRARVAAQFATLCAVLIDNDADINVDVDDARAVLRHATSLRVGSAGSSGPGRALRAARQAAAEAQAYHLGPAPEAPTATALLSILSHPTAELEMDELTTITEYLQQTLGNHQTEVIFGHGLQAGLPTELWVGVLFGYGPPLPPQPPRLLQPAPPPTNARTGRDFYFEAAAYLFMQRRRASSSLLQRQFLIGYNYATRLLNELAAAHIIAPDPEGRGWRLLVADEAALNELLAGLDEKLGD